MDEDSDCFVRRALWFNHSQLQRSKTRAPPINGHQYLYDVVQEAAKTPHAVCPNDVLQKIGNQQTIVIPNDDIPRLSRELVPTSEWQLQQVADFSHMRQLVERRRLLQDDTSHFNFPSNESEWHTFFFGGADEKNLPLLNLLLTINQPNLYAVLHFFVKWLEEGSIELVNDFTLRWLYAILACIELPLVPDSCSDMRELARRCHTERHRLIAESSDVSITPLSLLICIIGKYFQQFDLSD
ncbi:hypothetical protein AAG570_005317 [Ranatra chinensis]|uniref:Gem-associated protein 2 n=1 Tax=Ranatra chinensis TaxID=642074 RepID=A0ABD0YEX2_9HEMI